MDNIWVASKPSILNSFTIYMNELSKKIVLDILDTHCPKDVQRVREMFTFQTTKTANWSVWSESCRLPFCVLWLSVQSQSHNDQLLVLMLTNL